MDTLVSPTPLIRNALNKLKFKAFLIKDLKNNLAYSPKQKEVPKVLDHTHKELPLLPTASPRGYLC